MQHSRAGKIVTNIPARPPSGFIFMSEFNSTTENAEAVAGLHESPDVASFLRTDFKNITPERDHNNLDANAEQSGKKDEVRGNEDQGKVESPADTESTPDQQEIKNKEGGFTKIVENKFAGYDVIITNGATVQGRINRASNDLTHTVGGEEKSVGEMMAATGDEELQKSFSAKIENLLRDNIHYDHDQTTSEVIVHFLVGDLYVTIAYSLNPKKVEDDLDYEPSPTTDQENSELTTPPLEISLDDAFESEQSFLPKRNTFLQPAEKTNGALVQINAPDFSIFSLLGLKDLGQKNTAQHLQETFFNTDQSIGIEIQQFEHRAPTSETSQIFTTFDTKGSSISQNESAKTSGTLYTDAPTGIKESVRLAPENQGESGITLSVINPAKTEIRNPVIKQGILEGMFAAQTTSQETYGHVAFFESATGKDEAEVITSPLSDDSQQSGITLTTRSITTTEQNSPSHIDTSINNNPEDPGNGPDFGPTDPSVQFLNSFNTTEPSSRLDTDQSQEPLIIQALRAIDLEGMKTEPDELGMHLSSHEANNVDTNRSRFENFEAHSSTITIDAKTTTPETHAVENEAISISFEKNDAIKQPIRLDFKSGAVMTPESDKIEAQKDAEFSGITLKNTSSITRTTNNKASTKLSPVRETVPQRTPERNVQRNTESNSRSTTKPEATKNNPTKTIIENRGTATPQTKTTTKSVTPISPTQRIADTRTPSSTLRTPPQAGRIPLPSRTRTQPVPATQGPRRTKTEQPHHIKPSGQSQTNDDNPITTNVKAKERVRAA